MLRLPTATLGLLTLHTALAAAQPAPAPVGPRLQTLAGPDLQIGAHAAPGHVFSSGGAVTIAPHLRREVGLISTSGFLQTAYTAPGTFNDAPIVDHQRLVDWALAEGKSLHGWLPFGAIHTMQPWIREPWGDLPASTVDGYMQELVSKAADVATSGGTTPSPYSHWTVVNEAHRLSGGYTGTPWKRLGDEADQSGLTGDARVYGNHPVYIGRGLELAAAALPGAKLGIRDNNFEFPNQAHHDSMYQLARHLLNTGRPLDVIELQQHMHVYPTGEARSDAARLPDGTYDWEGWKAGIRRYQDLGLEVHLAEVDFKIDEALADSKAARRDQGRLAYAFTRAAREVGVDQLTFWGLRNASTGPGTDRADANLFDRDGSAKPSYYGVQQALMETLDHVFTLERNETLTPADGFDGGRFRFASGLALAGTYAWDMGSLIDVSGPATITASGRLAADVALDPWSTHEVLRYADGLSGSFGAIAPDLTRTHRLDYGDRSGAGSVRLVPLPEPATAPILLLTGALLHRRR